MKLIGLLIVLWYLGPILEMDFLNGVAFAFGLWLLGGKDE